MSQLALRFILRGGAFINSPPMPEQEAREKIRLILTGEYKLRGILRYGQHDHPEGGWTVSLDDVIAVHTFDPVVVQPAPVTAPQSPLFPFVRSGV